MSRLPAVTGIIDWAVTNPGAPDTILLLHSLGTNRTMWDGQVEWLAASGWRVIAVDLPGHGRSTASRAPYTVDTLARDLKEVSEICGAEEFVVTGISIGGLIGLWLAINLPERVSALIVANTAARLGSEAFWADRIAAVQAGGMEAIRGPVVSRFFAPGFEATHPELFIRYNAIFSSNDPTGYAGCCALLRDTDLTSEVGSIRCPTLVIGGGLDLAAPPEQSEWLHRSIGGSRLEIFEGAAHLSNLDQPDLFNEALVSFLTHPRRRGRPRPSAPA
ncbi:MAG TPA: alpha/beta fold hydrolase [Acidimicrobiia bacterium]